MRVTILAAGTRGDIDPFLALGLGLQARGHEVSVWTPPVFEKKTLRLGLSSAWQEQAQAEKLFPALLPSKLNLAEAHLDQGYRVFHEMLESTWLACQDADVIVYHGNLFSVPMIAEKLQRPRFAVLQAPIMSPTRAFPCPLLGRETSNGEENWNSYGEVVARLSSGIWSMVQDWRVRRLDLPALPDGANPFLTNDDLPAPILYCSSPELYGRPTDWSETTLAAGFWQLDDPDETPLGPELEDFLASGPAPVYFGFGSMREGSARRMTTLVESALDRLRLRGVIATGWGGLSSSHNNPRVFTVGSINHRHLFPRVAAVVHHGGASTTAAGLLAGRPTLVIPFLSDQPFWGNRVQALGLGPQPIPRKAVTVDTLAERLAELVGEREMRIAAVKMAERLRAEDGVREASQFVKRVARDFSTGESQAADKSEFLEPYLSDH